MLAVKCMFSACVCEPQGEDREVYYKHTQGVLGAEGERMRVKYLEAKDERDWERESEKKKVKARLEIDGVIVDCWLVLIWASQGCCLGRMLSFYPISVSLGVDQTWQPAYFSLFSLLFFYPCIFSRISVFPPLLSPFCHIVMVSSHWASHVSFSSLLSLHPSTVSEGAVDWKRAAGGRGERSHLGVKGESVAG